MAYVLSALKPRSSRGLNKQRNWPSWGGTRQVKTFGLVRVALVACTITIFSACDSAKSVDGAADTKQQTNGMVSIYRDEWGIPYMYADIEEDGYYGLGYSLAEDRPERYFEMVLWGTGQWAATHGDIATPLGIPASMLDDWAHQWMHEEQSKLAYDLLDTQTQKNIESFVTGFEKYFADHPGIRPDWAPKLEPWHTVAALRGLMWPFAIINEGVQDCQRGPEQLADLNSDFTNDYLHLASNEWALMPSKTAKGTTMLMSDPHSIIDGGLFFNEFNIRAGRIDASVYGIGPIAILGNTRNLAWAATTGGPDLSDCYEVTVDPANPRRYQYDGEWKDMEVREVAIEVKGADPIKKTYEYTRHNGRLSAVISRVGDKAYVVSTPYMDQPTLGIDQFQGFLIADSVDDAFSTMHDPKFWAQNYMFADRHGNVLYVGGGRTPIRPDGYDWTRPVPGNNSATAWLGIHPIDDLVWMKNPQQGYMKNTNEALSHIVRDGPTISPANYKSYIYNDPDFHGSRAYRIGDLLAEAESVTVEDAQAIVFDEMLPFTHRWLTALELAKQTATSMFEGLTDDEIEFLEDLLAFDGVMEQSSTSAAQYLMWRDALQSLLTYEQGQSIMGKDPDLAIETLEPGIAENLLGAIVSATKFMQENYGAIDIPYGDIHRLGRSEKTWPLGGGSVCLDTQGSGCEETLRAFAVRSPIDADGRRQPDYGARMIRLTVFGEAVQAYAGFNYGQSDDPQSPHYDDQARELFSGKKLRRIHGSEAELLAAGATKRDLSIPKDGQISLKRGIQ